MKISLKLYASLRDLLPPDTPWTGVVIDVPLDVTPNQVIDQYRVPRAMAHLVSAQRRVSCPRGPRLSPC